MDTESLTTNYLQKQTMLQQNQEVILNEVFEAVRDASSTENARAIQDSESNVAQEMKRIVKTLAKKGWSKNEIVYELQRIYGNDILILKQRLADERGFFGKNGVPITLSLSLMGYMLFRQRRVMKVQRAAQQLAEIQAQQAKAKEEAEKIDKDEILKKLNLKK